MGTNCAPLVADLFLFCYERDFMLSLSDNNQTDIIEAFNSTSRYLDDLLNIDNPYFEKLAGTRGGGGMISHSPKCDVWASPIISIWIFGVLS